MCCIASDEASARPGSLRVTARPARRAHEAPRADGYRAHRKSFDETSDGGHGRIEVRRVWASSDIEWLGDKKVWKGLRSVARIERVRTIGEQTSTERAYYISRRAPDAAVLGQLVRRHWSIENSLHWTLDVTFNEDRSRIRSKNGTQNFAALRKLALALLKRETSIPKLTSVARKRKRKRAACSNDHLLTVVRTAAEEN